MNFNEARAAWQAHKGMHEKKGVYLPSVVSYIPDEWRLDFEMAMDAQPSLVTDPNSAIPAFFTTIVDPKVFRILFAPNKAAEIFGEERKGTWLDDTAMFIQIESAGETSSYADYSNNGMVTANTNFPQRQAYLWQTIKQYGERELERAGLARVNWVAELDVSTATIHAKFANFVYFYGVKNLQNYGLLNDPNLGASLTPAAKAYGGTTWMSNGVTQATANEIWLDIQDLFQQLVSQTAGLVTRETKMTLALSPLSESCFLTTNAFAVNVSDLLKKNLPNTKVVTAIQYQQLSASNPQGIAGGNFMQLIADDLEGQDTGYCSFNEKMRTHKLIPDLSSYRQKTTGGAWGAIIRMPIAIASMIGI